MLTTTGQRRHLVKVFGPGELVPDGQGGWIEVPEPLDPPTWRCHIKPATVRDLERLTSGAIVTNASFVMEGRYHAGINTQTTIEFHGRTFYVSGMNTPDERRIETTVFATEQTG